MNDKSNKNIPRTMPRQSQTFTSEINAEIRRAAATGIYDIRGGGRILMTCCFSARQCHATRWRAIVRNAKPA